MSEQINSIKCKVCGETKALGEFEKNKNGGYSDVCRKCNENKIPESTKRAFGNPIEIDHS